MIFSSGVIKIVAFSAGGQGIMLGTSLVDYDGLLAWSPITGSHCVACRLIVDLYIFEGLLTVCCIAIGSHHLHYTFYIVLLILHGADSFTASMQRTPMATSKHVVATAVLL